MRINKRFTNTTFTHRPEPRDDVRTQEAPPEPIVCAGCGAVYVRKHWTHSPGARLSRKPGDPGNVKICDACRRRRSGVPHEFVHVDGEFVRLHRTDIVNLLKNEAARARMDNPLAQIIDWHGNGHTDDVLVTTTTEHLAIRLGRRWKRPSMGACCTASHMRTSWRTSGGSATRPSVRQRSSCRRGHCRPSAKA
jgi:hypothetical protein